MKFKIKRLLEYIKNSGNNGINQNFIQLMNSFLIYGVIYEDNFCDVLIDKEIICNVGTKDNPTWIFCNEELAVNVTMAEVVNSAIYKRNSNSKSMDKNKTNAQEVRLKQETSLYNILVGLRKETESIREGWHGSITSLYSRYQKIPMKTQIQGQICMVLQEEGIISKNNDHVKPTYRYLLDHPPTMELCEELITKALDRARYMQKNTLSAKNIAESVAKNKINPKALEEVGEKENFNLFPSGENSDIEENDKDIIQTDSQEKEVKTVMTLLDITKAIGSLKKIFEEQNGIKISISINIEHNLIIGE